jgi:hypothetical protein
MFVFVQNEGNQKNILFNYGIACLMSNAIVKKMTSL